MDKIQLIIDCDPGVDDALAIILALKHPAIEVLAICSVAGNGHIETTTQNGLKILSLCDREDIPLYQGADTAVSGERPDTVEAFGDDGLGGYAGSVKTDKRPEKEHAVDFLVRIVKENPKKLTIAAIGPCTNIASAIRKDPTFAGNVKEIVLMGGAKYTGNVSPVAEYNFWADPIAAKEVFKADFSKCVMIGLDVTNKIALDAQCRELLRIFDTRLSRFIYHITKSGMDENWEIRYKMLSPMHDILTIAYLIDEKVVSLKESNIDIVEDGIARGQSVVDIDGHWHGEKCNALYAVDVDVLKFYRLFLTTVFKEHKKEITAYLEQIPGEKER